MRILSVDYGEKRIGVAISDPTQTIVSPLAVINRSETGDVDSDIRQLEGLISRYDDIEEIIFGLPKNLKGQIGLSGRNAEVFAERLKASVGIPIGFWDERFTTATAERILIEADLSRSRRKKVIDKAAAAVILEDYLKHKESRKNR